MIAATTDPFVVLAVCGAFLLVFCALASVAERLIDRHDRKRRLS